MRHFILSFFIVSTLFSSFAVASDNPIESRRVEKDTADQCQSFIRNEAKKIKKKGYQCRSVMGIVLICDNETRHTELCCTGSEASIEIFTQDGSDWKRFYVD